MEPGENSAGAPLVGAGSGTGKAGISMLFSAFEPTTLLRSFATSGGRGRELA